MHVDRSLLGWGVFFVVAGGIPLGVQAGILSGTALERWWTYWPLILVGIGLGLIFTRTALEVVGGLIVAATFGLMVGGALSTGFGGIGDLPSSVCGAGDGGTPFQTQTGELAPRAEVDIELDCGELTVATDDNAATTTWSVEGSDDDGRGPRIESSPGSLTINPIDDGPSSFLTSRDTMMVTLPASSTIDLAVEVDAGSLSMPLGAASIETLDVELNAASAEIDLGGLEAIRTLEVGANAASIRLFLPTVSMTGSIETNAGSVTLCRFGDVALRLETGESIIASYDYASAGLVKDGSTWETPGFDTAPVRIELRTEANAGSFALDTEACTGDV